MKIAIDIPEVFEQHYRDDRFRDSLERLKADINLIAGNYERETVDMLIDAFSTAKEIVHCKECKHRITNHSTPSGYTPPPYNCPILESDDMYYAQTPEDDCFCSWAERKEVDDAERHHRA